MGELINIITKASDDFFKKAIKDIYPIINLKHFVNDLTALNKKDLWNIYTDGKSVYFDILNENELVDRFDDRAVSMYFEDLTVKDAVSLFKVDESYFESNDLKKNAISFFGKKNLSKILMYSNGFYLSAHEIGHKVDCPNCEEDKKKISKALFDGIEKKGIDSEGDVTRKVGNISNLVYDMILDTIWYARSSNEDTLSSILKNYDNDYLINPNQKDVIDGSICIFDVVSKIQANNNPSINSTQLYGQDADRHVLFLLSRALYADLFIENVNLRSKVKNYFLDDLKLSEKNRFIGILNSFLSEIPKKDLEFLNIKKKSYELSVLKNDRSEYLDSLIKIFSNPLTRYNALKGFAYEIADLIPKSPPPISRNNSEESSSQSGGGGSDVLDDLLPDPDSTDINPDNSVTPSQAEQILSDLAGDPLGEKKSPNFVKKAIDEYYKRHAKGISLKSAKLKNEYVRTGTDIEWQVKEKTIIYPWEESSIDWVSIMNFEQETGLIVLTKELTPNGELINYVKTEWEKIEIPIVGFNPKKSGIELPKSVVFIEDTSGSMFSTPGNVPYTKNSKGFIGNGSKIDLLKHIEYGLMKDLNKQCLDLNTEVSVGSVNFSSLTKYSGLFELTKVFNDSSNKFKDTILSPQSTGSSLDGLELAKAKNDVDKLSGEGNNYYVIITDGEISYDYKVQSTIDSILNDDNNKVLFFEIPSSINPDKGIQISYAESSLGKYLIGKGKNAEVFTINSLPQIQSMLTEIMIKEE
ncbi:MAG: hypothetical protein WC393_01790 [Candidatus Nanoarchaeia archaeon]|jgi:hypothetical protein